MIQTVEQLLPLIEEVQKNLLIGVDTEADSLYSYFEKLCLVQIGTAQNNYLIDPLEAIDLQPLLKALEKSTVIFHGADFDLRMMRRAGFFQPAHIFDTMTAAQLLGHESFSLAALVQQYFGIELVKTSQKADWSRRPLTEQMKEYARNDTRYLIALAEILHAELVKKKRIHWFEQSCERTLRRSLIEREQENDRWRIKGSSALSRRGGAVLKVLWEWREEKAKSLDKPAFKVLRNQDLLMVADATDKGKLWELPYLHGEKKREFKEAVARGLALPEEGWPQEIVRIRNPRNLEAEKKMRELCAVRDRIGAEYGITPSLIASKSTLGAIVREPEKAAELLLPWQLDLLQLR